MLCASFLSFVVLSLAGVPLCLADISLIVPNFNPRPLSVNIIGVGADGKTTYEMFAGQPTGTWIDRGPPFVGTATLVEDADNMIMEYANSALSVTEVETCTFVNGMADCVIILPGDGGPMTITEGAVSAIPIVVQGGGTGSPGPTPAVDSGVPAQMTPAPGGSVPGSSVATQSAPSPSISPSKLASSGVRLTPRIAGLAGMLAISAVLV